MHSSSVLYYSVLYSKARFLSAFCFVLVAVCVATPLLAQKHKASSGKIILKPLVEIITFERLHSLMQPNPDTVRVINFWATTCRPCIEEMPSFDRFHREYSVPKDGAKPVQILFVSLDFKRDIATKVIPFVKKRGIQAPVVFLGPPKSAEIDGVDAFMVWLYAGNAYYRNKSRAKGVLRKKNGI